MSEATIRRTTYQHGQLAETIVKQEADQLEKEAPKTKVIPQKVVISADGAFVPLTNGEWHEVKCMTIGEFEQQPTKKQAVKTKDISYFAGSYRIREFERYALPELHKRGVENASTIVAVNDGSEWIQSFIDYHCPQAERIIDFPHALSYVAKAGKAIWGEESDTFKQWFTRVSHQLKHKPPKETLGELQLLTQKAKNDEQQAVIGEAFFYLNKRLSMIDYPHFRQLGYPIGSGSVESAHKLLVHSRLKQAGMRWDVNHLDPMLALRNLICNDRWSTGWQDIVTYQQTQRRQRYCQRHQPPISEPFTFEKAGLPPLSDPPSTSLDEPTEPVTTPKPWKPADDHPWRHNIYPKK